MPGRLSLPLETYRRQDLAPVGLSVRVPRLGRAITGLGYGGQASIAGTVTDHQGNPIARLVRLYASTTGTLIAQQWSTAAGAYRFDNLDPDQRFYAIATDHAQAYNLTGADHLTPVVE